jgi:hypothetical protein
MLDLYLDVKMRDGIGRRREPRSRRVPGGVAEPGAPIGKGIELRVTRWRYSRFADRLPSCGM